LMNRFYAKLTGRDDDPYAWGKVLNWTPGGLVVGASIDLGALLSLTIPAIRGDKHALGQLEYRVQRVSRLFVPMYFFVDNIADVAMNMEGADSYAVKEIKALVTGNRPNKADYETERTFWEDCQKLFFGTKAEPHTRKDFQDAAYRLSDPNVDEDVQDDIKDYFGRYDIVKEDNTLDKEEIYRFLREYNARTRRERIEERREKMLKGEQVKRPREWILRERLED